MTRKAASWLRIEGQGTLHAFTPFQSGSYQHARCGLIRRTTLLTSQLLPGDEPTDPTIYCQRCGGPNPDCNTCADRLERCDACRARDRQLELAERDERRVDESRDERSVRA